MIRAVFKFAAIIVLILAYLVRHSIAAVLIRNKKRRLRFFLKSIAGTSGLVLKILNVQVKFPNGLTKHQASFIVSNHVSYLDALVIFRYYPSLFVTSVEIRETFLLGQLTALAGCFFVERRRARRNPETINQEMASMTGRLRDGFNIVLSPEGTSSNGSSVLPFKTPFFQMAIDCKVPIYPLCLKYVQINDEKFSPSNADFVCWYGDMTFPDHLFALCRQKKVIAHVVELAAVHPSEGQDRIALAAQCQQIVSIAYAQS